MPRGKIKRAAIYTRVSTDSQTTENQQRALTAVAEQRGWQIVKVYEDRGISGAKGRDQRPALDSLLMDATRGRFDVVMVWSIDRLGRSLTDLLNNAGELEAVGVDLYLDQQAIDTTTPAGRLFFHVSGAFAEFERGMIRERVLAGLRRAKARGVRLGRPSLGLGDTVRNLRGEGLSIRQIASHLSETGRKISPSGVAKLLAASQI